MDDNKKEKILIVHNYYQIPGGEDAVVSNESKMLRDNGHEVVLYTRNNTELKTMSKARTLLLPFITVFNIRTYRDIKRIIRNQHIDIVHVHNTLTLISPAVYYAAVKCKIPVVQTVHNFRLLCPAATFYRDGHICEDCVSKGLMCAFRHKCYRNSRLQTLACVINTKIHRMTRIYGKINYICLTEFNKEKLLQLEQIQENRVFVKPNFVDSIREPIPFEDREERFVYAGRLDKLKGVDILFETWHKMGRNAPELIVCGIGPMEEWCRKYILEHKCNIVMRGLVPNDETREIIARSKALILPTRWYEGFPMNIVEAYSVGTPVICSDIGNAGCLVQENVIGMRFDVDNEDSLVNVIKLLHSRMVKNCFEKYTREYTATKNYEMAQAIYDAITMVC